VSPKLPKLLLELDPSRDRTKDWRDSEKKTARNFGGRVQPGSGASMYAKGDVKEHSDAAHALDAFLLECKSTQGESISIRLEYLSKITEEAIGAGLQPALVVEFIGAGGLTERRWVMTPESVFLRMREENDRDG